MAIHILGIRHHGVGSAKNVLKELERIQPDIIMVEGAEEISAAFPYVGNKELVPPVAMMAYDPDNLNDCVFYPFAAFSPEWIAIAYANSKSIPVRAMDLPAAIGFAKKAQTATGEEDKTEAVGTMQAVPSDPLDALAEIGGFPSGEAWWEYHFEQQKVDAKEHFEGVMHTMEALRSEGVKSSLDKENVAREAYMRMLLRQAKNEMYDSIVVVCGAWHAPALVDLDKTEKEDIKTIKSLPKAKAKVAVSWIPWTNSRLSTFSGYGAGLYAPGWYEHQWKSKTSTEIEWLARVAKLLRKKGMDVSTAHIIEAYNLCRGLAALRGKYYVSLEDLNEAVLSVMCMGDAILLELIKTELIVGHKLGKTPSDVPKVPLQNDFEQQLKKLRLQLKAESQQLVLDLRKELDLKRSIFFYRLEILPIPWAYRTGISGKGTFKESWVAEWKPDMLVQLIEKAYLGNTIESAAQATIAAQCAELKSMAAASELILRCIPSELFESIDLLLDKVIELSVISSDVMDLMGALPNLVEVSRYGNVRKSDMDVLKNIVEQLFVKIFVGLPNACYGLNEENSKQMFELISKLGSALSIYNNGDFKQQWHGTLHKLLDKDQVNPIILGCVCRLLMDAQELDDEEIHVRISYALSVSGDPHKVASWLEGFLKGSAVILIYDNKLWNLLYQWVDALPPKVFMELLPLLRRTFSKFEYGERRQIGTKAKSGLVLTANGPSKESPVNFDHERAESILPFIKALAAI
jgi:hypothetical protein